MSRESQPEALLKPEKAKLDTSAADLAQKNLHQEAVKDLSSPIKPNGFSPPDSEYIHENEKGKKFEIKVITTPKEEAKRQPDINNKPAQQKQSNESARSEVKHYL